MWKQTKSGKVWRLVGRGSTWTNGNDQWLVNLNGNPNTYGPYSLAEAMRLVEGNHLGRKSITNVKNHVMESLVNRITVLTEALEFYAKLPDAGKVARAALKFKRRTHEKNNSSLGI